MINLVVKLDIYKYNRIKSQLSWFTKNIKNACKKKQKLYIKFINEKSFENLIRYKKYKNKLTSR